MTEMCKVRLWVINGTALAYCVSTVPKDRAPNGTGIWIPKSQVERITWLPEKANEWRECVMEMPEWLALKKQLL